MRSHLDSKEHGADTVPVVYSAKVGRIKKLKVLTEVLRTRWAMKNNYLIVYVTRMWTFWCELSAAPAVWIKFEEGSISRILPNTGNRHLWVCRFDSQIHEEGLLSAFSKFGDLKFKVLERFLQLFEAIGRIFIVHSERHLSHFRVLRQKYMHHIKRLSLSSLKLHVMQEVTKNTFGFLSTTKSECVQFWMSDLPTFESN